MTETDLENDGEDEEDVKVLKTRVGPRSGDESEPEFGREG